MLLFIRTPAALKLVAKEGLEIKINKRRKMKKCKDLRLLEIIVNYYSLVSSPYQVFYCNLKLVRLLSVFEFVKFPTVEFMTTVKFNWI